VCEHGEEYAMEMIDGGCNTIDARADVDILPLVLLEQHVGLEVEHRDETNSCGFDNRWGGGRRSALEVVANSVRADESEG
jgi:hypothetical protein